MSAQSKWILTIGWLDIIGKTEEGYTELGDN